jgi:glutamine cyclotransferase
MINELELVDNKYIYANIWQKNTILKIDKTTGSILKSYDMS